MVIFTLLMWNHNFSFGNTKSEMLAGAIVNRKMTADLQQSMGKVDKSSTNQIMNQYLNDGIMNQYLSDGCGHSDIVRNFKPEELEINCDNIHEVKLGKLLGSGLKRKVYEGEFRGRQVAVKKVWREVTHRLRTMIMLEAATSFQLRGASNIAPLLGWCDTTIVLSKAAGNLDQLIKEQEISVQRALKMALDITKGVQQLHSVPMVHLDFFPHQILFTDEGTLLLSDFDSVRYAGNSNSNTKCRDTKDNIYRLALMLWMLRAKKRPNRALWWQGMEQDRPPMGKMSDYPQAMQDLIVEAWDANPTKRPSATEMVQRIEAILHDHNS